jgi:hypothetical protein
VPASNFDARAYSCVGDKLFLENTGEEFNTISGLLSAGDTFFLTLFGLFFSSSF